MSREDLDPYIVLGVPRQASPDEIARAYRRAARMTHPDSGGSRAGSERFRLVSDAYELLRDPGRRAGYDRLHGSPRQEGVRPPGGSVRYAAPGSQHVVLGSRPSPVVGRPGLGTANGDELRAVHTLGDIEGFFAMVRLLLRAGS